MQLLINTKRLAIAQAVETDIPTVIGIRLYDGLGDPESIKKR